MLINTHFLFGLGALVSLATAAPTHGILHARDLPNDDCNAEWLGSSRADGVPWADGQEVDKYFCTSKWSQGAVAVGIQIWTDPTRVTGMQVSFSDGTKSPIIGMQSVDATNENSLQWGVEERITELRTWRSEDGGAVGKIKIKVGDKQLEIGSSKLGKNNVGTGMEVHGGMLLAVRGRTNSGPHLQTVEFRFMPSTPKRVDITSLDFPEDLNSWNSKQKGIETVSLSDAYIPNKNPEGPDNNKEYKFSNQIEKENTHKIETGSDKAFGIMIGTKVGFSAPLGGASGEVNRELSFSYTWKKMESLEDKKKTTMNWEESGTIVPGKAVHCQAKSMSGHYASDFTATIEIEVADGTTFTYKQKGHYDSVGWSNAWSNCQLMELKDIPEGANIIEVD